MNGEFHSNLVVKFLRDFGIEELIDIRCIKIKPKEGA